MKDGPDNLDGHHHRQPDHQERHEADGPQQIDPRLLQRFRRGGLATRRQAIIVTHPGVERAPSRLQGGVQPAVHLGPFDRGVAG